MTLLNKITASIIILLLAFCAGFLSGKKEIIKTQDKIVYKDRIVTVTKIQKPDGTIVTETKTEDKQGSQTKTAERPVLPRYSAGIIATPNFNKFQFDYGATAGIRLFDNVWTKASYTPALKYLTLGIELQF